MDSEFVLAEIEMPDGQRVYHSGRRWKFPDRETEAVVEYFAALLPEHEYYPEPVVALVKHVVKSMVHAKLIRLDLSRRSPYDPKVDY